MAKSGESRVTTDHDEIKRWAESRGGRSAIVESTAGQDDDSGVFRIEFRDEPALEEVDWNRFFKVFDERGLAFLYQDRTSDGKISRFNKFVRR